MRLIHAADIHLGKRAYDRLAPSGLNLRETDIARVFTQMVNQWIALRPDVIVVAGDLFDSPRPSNPATVHADAQFTRLLAALPGTLVVVVSGNHDMATATISGSIMPLLAARGVHVVDRQAKRLRFPDRDLAILCVPDGARVALEPDPGSRYNVLVLHGGLEDVTPKAARGGRDRLTAHDLHAERWTYTALGDYHCRTDFGPNCGYSGSMEFTSPDIWSEIAQHPKGFVEFDLATGERTFHAVALARPVIDLPVIDAMSMDAATVDAALAANVATVSLDGALVRQVVVNLSGLTERNLDHKAKGSYKARAMHYHWDPRRPERVPVPRLTSEELDSLIGQRIRNPRLTIEEMLAVKLKASAEFTGDDNEELMSLGLQYLRQAEASESAEFALVQTPPTPERRSEAA